METIEAIEKVRDGCLRYMHLIDELGQCRESDEYVVALHFFDTYMETLNNESNLKQ
jgi:hypothetical protein|tara:strand:- start:1499 stop:1666 length:168 start_codon:yes stop_codon:yes gene_type:complete